MRTNVVLDDQLVDEALRLDSGIRTKRELIDTALREFIQRRRMKSLRELRGKICFADGYEYKAMRSGE
ncbi:MAG: type II toxin-antitoxin system VapB family antitoxin [Acidobacteriota bacterium]|jgi:Arc/MetJ family transcription regulator|nr:type II toxin-antitoxin system VapB family antitoxin [Acidobacteriota bacterium]